PSSSACCSSSRSGASPPSSERRWSPHFQPGCCCCVDRVRGSRPPPPAPAAPRWWAGGRAGWPGRPPRAPRGAAAPWPLCGAGLGLLTGVLDEAALHGPASVIRNGSLVVGARHAGLVLGLVLIAPVLAGSLDRATERSALAGAGVVLDARVPAQDKLKITFAVRDKLDVNQRGAVPDLEKDVAGAGVTSASGLRVGDALAERIEGILTRAFRPAFGVAAALGFAVLVPGLIWAVRRQRNEPSADEHPSRAEPDSTGSGTG